MSTPAKATQPEPAAVRAVSSPASGPSPGRPSGTTSQPDNEYEPRGAIRIFRCASSRPAATRSSVHAEGSAWGYGRELFGAFRHVVTTAEQGATVCFALPTGSRGNDDTPPNPNFVDRTVDA